MAACCDFSAGRIIAIVRNLLARPVATELRGIFHITGDGDTKWAEFATSILAVSAAAGGPSARVMPVATSENVAAARRPANSRLDNSRLGANSWGPVALLATISARLHRTARCSRRMSASCRYGAGFNQGINRGRPQPQAPLQEPITRKSSQQT